MDQRHAVSAIIAGYITLVACLPVAAQSVQDGASADHIRQAEPGHFYYTIMPRDGEAQRFDLDLTEDVQIIVEFEEAPLFVQQQKGLATAGKASAMQRRFAQLEADLEKIYQHLTPVLSKQASAPKLERTFYKVFYGASLTVPRMALGDLQQLDYVRRIHLNKRMEAYLNESVPLIRADEVQQTFGTRGEGVIVAILDTGIDYTHPALGGGFGEGFKVIGGYDFVNDDADPMDDNGHGTHVAGIVAADGENLQGVAPGVSLMAYKVLNGDGGGEEADIIAAIERVADPNEDGDFSDHVAVANMSLGGPGNPDDAVSMAVDHAVSIGVTFCIAAGNTGSFRTIGSPGTAAAAITVGASDKSDEMAFFSAKGPVTKTYAIKPDLVAPGVEIHSAALQEGMVALNGTSMATPHVAGVASLLKAIHPTWEPADIKSAMMTTAVLFSDEAMVQGGGRIAAAQAAQAQVFVEPSHLSFGLADVASSNWVTTQTLLLTNRSPESQAFSVSLQGTRSGVSLTTSPSSFTIDPGAQQQVEVTLRVNHELVPFRTGGSLAYSGTLTFNNATQSLHLPWAFVKAATAVVTYDQPFPVLLWANEFYFTPQAVLIDPYTLETTLPAGEYDLMLIDATQVHERVPFIFEEGARIFIKEGLNVDGAFDLTLHSSEASLLIDLDGQDEQGQLLSDLPKSPERLGDWYQTRYRMLYPPSSFLQYVDFGFVISDKLNVSAISDRFTVLPGEFYADLGSQNHAYAIQHAQITGIQEDVIRATTPADLSDQPVRVVFPPGTNIPQIRFMNVLHNKEPGHALSDAISFSALDVPEGVWDGEVFVTPDVHANYAFTTAVAAMADDQGFPVIQTQPFRAADKTVRSFLEFSPSPVVYQPTPGEVLTFGAAPIHPNFNTKISNANGITSFLQFYGPHHEERIQDGFAVVHTLYDAQGTVLASAEGDRFFEYRDAIPPGAYRLETVLDRYFVDGEPGKATLNVHFTFDTDSDDFDAPTFTSLRVLNEQDRAVSRLTVNEAASLTFSAADYILAGRGREYKSLNTEATWLSYRRFGTDTWQPLAFETVLEEDDYFGDTGHLPIGLLYKANLSALTTDGDAAFDLRISIEDQSGKVSEWTLEPGFLVGDFEIPVGIEDDPAAGIEVPNRFQLHANYPNPFNPSTTIRFDLPAQERISLKIYDTLGREVAVLVDEPMPAGKHTVPFDTRGLASGMYLYRLETSRFSDARTMILLR